tara:strand:+ start:405 stop:704 length:300 start_codon:yes stop_codon:yes gene_type:complete
MAVYKNNSPYRDTGQNSMYLELLNIRAVPASSSDVLYTIEPHYNNRPDLLAFDLYEDPKLWWVFVQRNMDTIKDPIYDFQAGTAIYIPKMSNLKKFLGI